MRDRAHAPADSRWLFFCAPSRAPTYEVKDLRRSNQGNFSPDGQGRVAGLIVSPDPCAVCFRAGGAQAGRISPWLEALERQPGKNDNDTKGEEDSRRGGRASRLRRLFAVPNLAWEAAEVDA